MGKELTYKFFETAMNIGSVVIFSTIGAGLVNLATRIANTLKPAIDHIGIAEAEPYTLAIGLAIYAIITVNKKIKSKGKDKE